MLPCSTALIMVLTYDKAVIDLAACAFATIALSDPP